MAQGPVPASELERGIRKDQISKRYTDQQDQFPTAQLVSDQTFHRANLPILSENYPCPLPQVKLEEKSATRTKGGITLWLAIAVIILLVLAIVEGGLLGSKIARTKNFCSELERYVYCINVANEKIVYYFRCSSFKQLTEARSLSLSFCCFVTDGNPQ